MSKYIGHESGLIGPVPPKPLIHPADCEPGSLPYKASQMEWEAYEQALSSLPVIPCEGWVPVKGQEYDEKDFRWQYQYRTYLLTDWVDCSEDKYEEVLSYWPNDYARIVAVPLPAANEPIGFMPFLKELKNYFGEHDKTPFEHKAFAMVEKIIQSIQAVETVPDANDGGDGFSELHPEKLTKPMSDKKEDWLAYFLQNVHKAKDLTHLFNSIWDASVRTTYPAKFVEWVGQTYRHYNDGHGQKFWLKYYHELTPITGMDVTEYTLPELYTEWNKTK